MEVKQQHFLRLTISFDSQRREEIFARLDELYGKTGYLVHKLGPSWNQVERCYNLDHLTLIVEVEVKDGVVAFPSFNEVAGGMGEKS